LGFILLRAAEAPQAPQHIHYPLPLTHLGAITLSGSARFTSLLDFRECYYTRSGLLDHLDSDGFDYWSDRPFHFPRDLLRWRALGLGLGNRSLRRFRSLGCLTRLTALS
jgi:hypothetical protein